MKKQRYDLSTLTKGNIGKGEELTSRLFKVISKPVGIFLIKYTPFTANQVTVASYIALILGALFFLMTPYSTDPYSFRLIGAGFAVLLYLLDDVDGMVARAKFQTGIKGKWMDSIVGFVFPSLLFFSLAFSFQSSLLFLIGSLAMVCFPIQYSIIYSFKLDIQPGINSREDGNEFLGMRKDNKWRYIYGSATIYPILFFSCLFNIAWFPLLFYATFGNLFWMIIALLQYNSVRRVK